ncbi:MAG: lipid-A-disaccharide synthase [Francisellaceae bacterium]|jgi:lipid-A-disaccharide synthase
MHIILVAGEPSGDQLGEGLVAKLRENYPDAKIEGIAGPLMQSAGCKSLFPMETLSVMGIVEVLKHLPAILKIRFNLLKYLKENKPDIYIGIDAPDFNLPVEKKLKKLGIKVVHYVSPSVWAWRSGRMKSIKAATDVVLSILPFEEKFYKDRGHRAVFVGHPLANKIPLEPNIEKARKLIGLDSDDLIIGLLPGSRLQEVDRLLEPFLEGVQSLKIKLNKNFTVLIPIAKPSLKNKIKEISAGYNDLNIKLIDGNAHIVQEACDYILLASGTAALEAMLYKKPMVMAYKLSAITHRIALLLIKSKFYSLPNILADKPLITELLQYDVNRKRICDELFFLIDNDKKTKELVKEFYVLHKLLTCDADQKSFQVVKSLLEA